MREFVRRPFAALAFTPGSEDIQSSFTLTPLYLYMKDFVMPKTPSSHLVEYDVIPFSHLCYTSVGFLKSFCFFGLSKLLVERRTIDYRFEVQIPFLLKLIAFFLAF